MSNPLYRYNNLGRAKFTEIINIYHHYYYQYIYLCGFYSLGAQEIYNYTSAKKKRSVYYIYSGLRKRRKKRKLLRAIYKKMTRRARERVYFRRGTREQRVFSLSVCCVQEKFCARRGFVESPSASNESNRWRSIAIYIRVLLAHGYIRLYICGKRLITLFSATLTLYILYLRPQCGDLFINYYICSSKYYIILNHYNSVAIR